MRRTGPGDGHAGVAAPRVLIVLAATAAWSRGLLRGFSERAHAQGWDLVHYYPGTDLGWLARDWEPAATVLGPEVGDDWPAALRSPSVVSVNRDRTAQGVPSVCLDEPEIARLALRHLLSKGLSRVTTFRYDESAFAVVRERAFRDAASASGAQLVEAWSAGRAESSRTDPATLAGWVSALPKPCGVFACCDAWAQVVVRYARAAGVRVPEDLAVVGVDNDPTICELATPPLSSVSVPWQDMGGQAARLVGLALAGKPIAGRRIVIAPGPVMSRRSSDALAIDDDLVARAVRYIRDHSQIALTVPSLARAGSPASRRRLERRFHVVLGRTVVQEIRRTRVEAARQLLTMTRHPLSRVAKLAGFSNAALLSVAFRREVGLPPGAYRRRAGGEPAEED